jgi:tetratricopeptide (TPR) repeat protein
VSAAELLEQGIRAYATGALDEAERCWERALALDPGNDRARSYLDVLVAKRGARAPEVAPVQVAAAPARAAPAGRPVPLPAPAAQTAAPPPRAGSQVTVTEPIPLPGRSVTQPSWMRPPVTLVPDPPPPPLAAAAAPRSDDRTTLRDWTPPASAPPEGATPARADHISVTEYAPSPWDEGPALAPSVEVQDGDGLDLATVEEQSGLRSLVPDAPPNEPRAAPRPRSDIEVWLDGARELFALGDFSGSLEMIEKILKVDPNHTEARLYLDQNEATLTSMYESKLGPQDATPRLAIQPEEVMWLNLDHRAGFLLAQIDGTVTYEDLFAVSGLPRLDTARILATLLQEGVITA